MRFLRMMFLSVAALSAGACEDFLSPWGSAGTYDLYSANSDPVPSVVYSQTGAQGYTVTLSSGTLRLRSDDSFTLDLDYVEDDGHTITRYTQGVAGEWSSDQDTIWLDYVNPNNGRSTSLGAIRRHDSLELTIPGAVSGTSIRTVFTR